jgi:RNA polymerase sigma-70 factor (ECF subfamily)
MRMSGGGTMSSSSTLSFEQVPHPPPGDPEPAPADERENLGQLLELVATGHRDSFTALYDATAGRVYGLTRTVLRNNFLAEEVTQDVFLEIWQCAARFDRNRGTALSWIMMLARSRAVDKVRHHQAVFVRDHRDAVRSYQPEIDGVVEAVLVGQDRAQLRQALIGITHRQKEAIVLTFFAGHSYPEASSILGIPLSTLKTRVRDGLINLRTALEVIEERKL